jgi:hypothetical protein
MAPQGIFRAVKPAPAGKSGRPRLPRATGFGTPQPLTSTTRNPARPPFATTRFVPRWGGVFAFGVLLFLMMAGPFR